MKKTYTPPTIKQVVYCCLQLLSGSGNKQFMNATGDNASINHVEGNGNADAAVSRVSFYDDDEEED